MANNDLVRVEFGTSSIPDNQTVYKELNSIAANIIGTAYKGPAFIPQVLFNRATLAGTDVRNNFINKLGTHRQNMYMHLYDGYTCNTHSDAYDAASTWFVSGGEYAYFTRVLGIGTGIKSTTIGKMIGSGFNLSKNISSGTLDHKTSDYPNANSGGDPGSIGFVIRNITEIGKSSQAPENSNPGDNLDYFYELGIDDTANILTDVIMFASGVLPEMSNNNDSNDSYSDILADFDNIGVNTQSSTSHFIDLRNFNPKNIPLEAGGDPENDGGIPENPDLKINISSTNTLVKDTAYIDNNINQLPERFYEKGHLRYASYPLSGFINDAVENTTTTSILLSRDYSTFSEEDKSIIPDYNSFESEYQTAKTPWVTSQPLDRSDFGESGDGDNRENIHNKVDNLFRFWSLDDGEIGNRFRIKINPKRCGDISIADVSLANDEDFVTFDLYIFEYDARVNEFYDTKSIEVVNDDRARVPVEEYIGLNLNPNSTNYIGRVIGTVYEYYDFDADKIVRTGKYENKSNYLRVEITEDIESLLYSNQHMLIPSGFRSYPHIRLKKEAFSHYTDVNKKGIDLAGIFDTNKIYQLPPLYALNYYKDGVLRSDTGIENNWGVVFTPAKVNKSNLGVFTLKRKTNTNRRDINTDTGAQDLPKEISPHYCYSKYFLSGISNKNNENIYTQITLNEGENIPTEGDWFKINVSDKNGNSKNITFVFKDGEVDEFTQIELTQGFKKLNDGQYHILINSSINSTNIIKAASNIKNLFSTFDAEIMSHYNNVSNLFDIEVNENVISIVQTNKDLEVSVSTSNSTTISVRNYSDYNVWIEEDNYLNSFFHLEKIVFRNVLNLAGELASNFASSTNKHITFKHSGGVIARGGYEYIDLSNRSRARIWNEDRNIVDKLNNKLSFDFFTYGGFDGIDIRDNDKRFFKNDAIIRELHDENETKSVYTAYNKAIDIATDSGNADTDIIVVPGIKEIPIIRKCINICEDTKKHFFIADVSGACSNVLLNFTNQTIVSPPGGEPPIYADTLVKTSLGVMGDQFVLDNKLADDYTRDKILIRDADDRFLLTHNGIPQLGDSISYYNYKSVIEGQFENVISLWPTYYIQSKYFMPVLGDISAVDTNGFNKKVCPEVFTLGVLAGSSLRGNITNISSPSFLQSFNVTMSLISNFMNESGEAFNSRADRLKNAVINPIFRPTGADTIKLLSQNTSYEIRGSLFKDQGIVRTIQQIKKRIMYNIFLDESIVSGGILFSQNANMQNLYDKITIQLNNLLSRFVEENLITDYKLRIPRAGDDKTILDMQNYILRGNIILQLNNSDIISLGIDNILYDLSLLADPDEAQIIQLN